MVLAITVAVILGRGPAFLVLAAGVLLGAIWVFWESLQSLTGEAPLTLEEAIGLGAPSSEEERKRSVLRTLKDLEYERGVGKISEQDYKQLSAKYRQEAKELLQVLDSSMGPARARAEELLAARLDDSSVAKDEKDDEDDQGSAEGSEKARDAAPSDEEASLDSNGDSDDSGSDESGSNEDESGTDETDNSPGGSAATDSDKENKA